MAIALTGGLPSKGGGDENTAAAAAARDVRLAGVNGRRRPRGDGEPPAVVVIFCVVAGPRNFYFLVQLFLQEVSLAFPMNGRKDTKK